MSKKRLELMEKAVKILDGIEEIRRHLKAKKDMKK